MRRVFIALIPLLFAGCSSPGKATSDSELRVRRDTFVNRVTLTGELEARRGETLSVPRLPTWESSIEWMVEDGEFVRKGDRVVELAAGELPGNLESNRQSEMQAREELQQRNSEWSADLEQKRVDVDKKRAEYEKARIQAAVPADLLAPREAEERQLALERTAAALAKAEEVLASRLRAVEAERANLVLRLDATRREISRSSQALESLVMTAPQDGIVVVRDMPWLGRKLQQGDKVWVGFPIAVIPELSSLEVTAWLADVDDGRVVAGMPAVVTLDGYPSRRFKGRIRSVAAVAQDTARTSQRRHFRVVVTLDDPDTEILRPGLSARVDIENERRDNVLIVPRSAVRFTRGAATVALAGGDTRTVNVSLCNASECVVTNGLEEGTRLRRFSEVPDA